MKNKTNKLLLSGALSIAIGLGSLADLSAQVSFGGQPRSFSEPVQEGLRSGSSFQEPVIRLAMMQNVDDLLAQSDWDGAAPSIRPFVIGQRISTSIDMAKEAEQFRLQDGTTIYRLTLQSDGAKALYPTFDRFLIPQGARLYVYNADRTVVHGAYTYESNPGGGAFASVPVSGDKMILEYESNVAGDAPQIVLDGLVYIFREQVAKMMDVRPGENETEYPNCMVNANCPEGEAYYDQKSGIAQIFIITGNGSTTSCTGTLLNNTQQDFTPYIITAAHCVGSEADFPLQQKILDQWVFSFHYLKPGCYNGASASYYGKSMVGCTKVAYLPTNEYSDGLLLKLKTEVPVDYRVFYNGWDRRTALPSHGACLHHPMGDAMKISVFKRPARLASWREILSKIYGAANAHMQISFETGTEGGSSGSGLFNPERLLVGTLTGGGSPCTKPQLAEDYYGRLAAHWDWFSSKGQDRQMATFLDPVGKGKAETLRGTYRDGMKHFYPVAMLNASLNGSNSVLLKWNAPSGADLSEASIKYKVMRNGEVLPVEIEHQKGKTVLEYRDDISSVQATNEMISYQVRAVYTDLSGVNETTWSPRTSALVGQLTKELTPTVKAAAGAKTLTWDKPAHYAEWSKIGYPDNAKFRTVPTARFEKKESAAQTLSKLTYSETWQIGGAMQEVQDESEKMYIVQYNVLPTKAGSKIYAYVRDLYRKTNSPSVEIKVPDTWKDGEWLSVPLSTPLQIRPHTIFLVGFSTDNDKDVPFSIAYADGSADEFSRYESSYFLVPRKDEDKPFEFVPLQEAGVETFGGNYLAIRLVLSESSTALKEPMKDVKWGSNGIFAFPKVKEYIVKRNGQEIARTSATTYKDNEAGLSEADYSIEVVYRDPINSVSISDVEEQQVSVYPTTVVDRVNILHAAQADRVDLYTVDGSLLKSWSSPSDAESYDLSNLQSGTYLMRIHMPLKPLVVKLIKR
ncbi:MAG: T9SS type A sorting domain-containing protein [Porphyromonas sp.]|nr:T9SS type A sorting domain-containing protein [Porphyromonas sp.]